MDIARSRRINASRSALIGLRNKRQQQPQAAPSHRPSVALSRQALKDVIQEECKDVGELAEKMLANYQVQLGLGALESNIGSVKVLIVSESDDPRSVELAKKFLKLWNTTLPFMIGSVPNNEGCLSHGRVAFEKVFRYDRANNLQYIEELVAEPYKESEMCLDELGRFDGIDLKPKKGPETHLDADKSLWVAIGATVMQPHGKSLLLGAPAKIWKSLDEARDRLAAIEKRIGVGGGIIYHPQSEEDEQTRQPWDVAEWLQEVLADLKSGGWLLLPNGFQSDGKTPKYQVAGKPEVLDTAPLLAVITWLETCLLRAMRIPEKTLTEGDAVGSHAMVKQQTLILYAVIDALLFQFVNCFQVHVIDKTIALNWPEGQRPVITITFPRLAERPDAFLSDVCKALVEAASLNPLVLSGGIKLGEILEQGGIPVAEDFQAKLDAFVKQQQATQAQQPPSPFGQPRDPKQMALTGRGLAINLSGFDESKIHRDAHGKFAASPTGPEISEKHKNDLTQESLKKTWDDYGSSDDVNEHVFSHLRPAVRHALATRMQMIADKSGVNMSPDEIEDAIDNNYDDDDLDSHIRTELPWRAEDYLTDEDKDGNSTFNDTAADDLHFDIRNFDPKAIAKADAYHLKEHIEDHVRARNEAQNDDDEAGYNLASRRAATVDLAEFDASKHPRDHGKFAHIAGAAIKAMKDLHDKYPFGVPLHEIHSDVSKGLGVSLGEFHDVVRHLADTGHAVLHPFTQAAHVLTHGPTALLRGQEIKYYARPTGKTGTIEPPEDAPAKPQSVDKFKRALLRDLQNSPGMHHVGDQPANFAATHGLTRGQMEDALRELHAGNQINFHEWNEPHYKMRNEEHGLIHGNGIVLHISGKGGDRNLSTQSSDAQDAIDLAFERDQRGRFAKKGTGTVSEHVKAASEKHGVSHGHIEAAVDTVRAIHKVEHEQAKKIRDVAARATGLNAKTVKASHKYDPKFQATAAKLAKQFPEHFEGRNSADVLHDTLKAGVPKLLGPNHPEVIAESIRLAHAHRKADAMPADDHLGATHGFDKAAAEKSAPSAPEQLKSWEKEPNSKKKVSPAVDKHESTPDNESQKSGAVPDATGIKSGEKKMDALELGREAFKTSREKRTDEQKKQIVAAIREHKGMSVNHMMVNDETLSQLLGLTTKKEEKAFTPSRQEQQAELYKNLPAAHRERIRELDKKYDETMRSEFPDVVGHDYHDAKKWGEISPRIEAIRKERETLTKPAVDEANKKHREDNADYFKNFDDKGRPLFDEDGVAIHYPTPKPADRPVPDAEKKPENGSGKMRLASNLPKHSPSDIKITSRAKMAEHLQSKHIPRPPKDGEQMLYLVRPQSGPQEFREYAPGDLLIGGLTGPHYVVTATKPGFTRTVQDVKKHEQLVVGRPATKEDHDAVSEQRKKQHRESQALLDVATDRGPESPKVHWELPVGHILQSAKTGMFKISDSAEAIQLMRKKMSREDSEKLDSFLKSSEIGSRILEAMKTQ